MDVVGETLSNCKVDAIISPGNKVELILREQS